MRAGRECRPTHRGVAAVNRHLGSAAVGDFSADRSVDSDQARSQRVRTSTAASASPSTVRADSSLSTPVETLAYWKEEYGSATDSQSEAGRPRASSAAY